MRNFLARFTIALVLFHSLIFVPAFSQEGVRPRRSQVDSSSTSSPTPKEEWKAPDTGRVLSSGQNDSALSKQEPVIRVALATDTRSATISTSGQLMNATDVANTFVALSVPRVRLEARSLSAAPQTLEPAYRVQIAGLASRNEAEERAKEVRETTGEETLTSQDAETKTWGLLVGNRHSLAEAEELRARLEDAGLAASVVPSTTNTSNSTLGSATRNNEVGASSVTGGPIVRPVSRFSSPSREVVAFSAGSGRLFSSSAPVTFAAADDKIPVRFNDQPYRGRIEVFANTRGALTVVNVLGLEDYVRGVVPNELSAGGFPLIEAHKAQAIAARTYALRNRGQFMAQGYDLLPTTRSQVYKGLASENTLSSRAVDETRGLIATFDGQPINALYTSTCGGRTEDSQNIFNDEVGYLKGRECAAEGRAALATFTIKTSRDPAELKSGQNLPLAREVAILSLHNFTHLKKVTDHWLEDDSEVDEVRSWLASVARLARQIAPTVTEDVHRPPAFATALSIATFGESRGSTLLNNADVDYLLAVRDAGEVPQLNRADVAYLIREGYLSLLPDATLNPREPLSRGRALHSIARLLETRGFFQLQKGTARPTSEDNLVLRSTKGKDQPIKVSSDAFLFRQIGENLYPVRSLAVVGGEPVVFHVNSSGEVDYLEVKPAPNGAAADRFSPFSNWTTELSLGQAQARLSRYARGFGSLLDLRVAARGKSQRAVDLELIGSTGVGHVRGGRIRSALGLREQLFVIERKYDDDGRVTGFAFIGRGWGHGVGMCQVGAYGLARQGFTYEQILKSYYAGIEMTRLY
ncbi:MAG TPA: SpoIID/LytB domain-containing protein [Pyrinomonadaceae bacterium]|nr:SpoIID/LytB domain-containing protein [Pyrinomonadaceae bacterium]